MSDVISPGRDKAKKAARLQEQQIAEQRRAEEVRLAEEESEIARRKALTAKGAGGRSLLIATSQTGASNTLGGGGAPRGGL